MECEERPCLKDASMVCTVAMAAAAEAGWSGDCVDRKRA